MDRTDDWSEFAAGIEADLALVADAAGLPRPLSVDLDTRTQVMRGSLLPPELFLLVAFDAMPARHWHNWASVIGAEAPRGGTDDGEAVEGEVRGRFRGLPVAFVAASTWPWLRDR